MQCACQKKLILILRCVKRGSFQDIASVQLQMVRIHIALLNLSERAPGLKCHSQHSSVSQNSIIQVALDPQLCPVLLIFSNTLSLVSKARFCLWAHHQGGSWRSHWNLYWGSEAHPKMIDWRISAVLFIYISSISHSSGVDLDLISQKSPHSFNLGGNDFVQLPAMQSLDRTRRSKVKSLRQMLLKRERIAQRLEQSEDKASTILAKRKANYEKATARFDVYKLCLKSRRRLREMCQNNRYYVRHSSKCRGRTSCGNGGKLWRYRQDCLKLVEEGEQQLSDIRSKLSHVQKSIKALRRKLSDDTKRKPVPSNKPRLSVYVWLHFWDHYIFIEPFVNFVFFPWTQL